ncbi:MAG: glycosyltransferase [Cyanobacteria bacterium P01_H01_bin.15]
MTSERPFVSVIVPIYNGEADLVSLLSCLRAQTYPRDRSEFLLVNNNSRDRTGEILGQAAKNAKNEGWNLQALAENQIQSSYAARNVAIRVAQGEILAFTDADCRPLPTWVEELANPFTDPAIGLVVGEVAALPGETLLEQYAELSKMMSQHFLLEHPFCPYGQTANLGVRKQAFEQVGLFRPYLTTGGDADICWRIQREADWQITYAPNAIIQHRHRDNLADFRSQFRRYGRSNRYLHELHGVKLMKSPKPLNTGRRIVRWVFKEIPKCLVQIAAKQAPPVVLARTPYDLIGSYARYAGQEAAKLPPAAREIPRL